MENRNVKIIDEHGIDRNGNVICTLGVDGKEYVLYSIERDLDNDNLFVSLLTKNNDGTANMVNIENDMEKNTISDIAKQVVTFSVNNEASKTDGNVKLANGKEVSIGTALFNKEQTINVGKTYITTVKKSVTKVSGDFYKIDDSEPSTLNNVTESVVESVPTPITPVVSEPAPVEPVLPEVNPLPNEGVISETPVVPEAQVSPAPAPEAVVEAPVEANNLNVEPILPNVAPAPITPVLPEPTPVAPIVSTPAQVDNSGLIFDASKETNLNAALGEVTSDTTLPVQDVSSIREFGQNQSTPEMNIANVPPAVDNGQSANVPPAATGGFANNKFFVVVAILLFVAACVFLGYEAFKYFNLVK